MSVGQLYVYDEIVKFLISQPTVEDIVDFELSHAGKERVRKLVEAKRRGVINTADREELAEFIRVERFLQNLKLRAERRLRTLYL